MMLVSVNHLLLQIESNSFKLSCMRFWKFYKTLLARIERESFKDTRNHIQKTHSGYIIYGQGNLAVLTPENIYNP